MNKQKQLYLTTYYNLNIQKILYKKNSYYSIKRNINNFNTLDLQINYKNIEKKQLIANNASMFKLNFNHEFLLQSIPFKFKRKYKKSANKMLINHYSYIFNLNNLQYFQKFLKLNLKVYDYSIQNFSHIIYSFKDYLIINPKFYLLYYKNFIFLDNLEKYVLDYRLIIKNNKILKPSEFLFFIRYFL